MKTFLSDYGKTISSELQKSRRTLSLWVTFLFPLFSVILVVLPLIKIDLGDDNLWARYVHNLSNIAAFFLPFFIIVLVGFYCHIEHKSNTWKHLLVQPVSKSSVYFGKLSMILILMLVSFACFMLFAVISIYGLHMSSARYGFEKYYPDFGRLALLLLKVYASASVIVTFQYWISNRFRNLIGPIIIGISLIILPIAVLVVLGMAGLLEQKDLVQKIFAYDPYSYPFTNIFNFLEAQTKPLEVFPRLSQIYLAISVLLCGLSYWDFLRKDVK